MKKNYFVSIFILLYPIFIFSLKADNLMIFGKDIFDFDEVKNISVIFKMEKKDFRDYDYFVEFKADFEKRDSKIFKMKYDETKVSNNFSELVNEENYIQRGTEYILIKEEEIYKFNLNFFQFIKQNIKSSQVLDFYTIALDTIYSY
ncbi:hypothetical protein OF820_04065 [Oceanotoga sp. DSM 15011]|jgi:hypothetical protein|uniref:Uncharacterized protein n=1 Tax=Oceanotoga teriensis TaxID=515440 RepID=A0AA45C878_9BACT|nr:MULTISPECIES: hypothetical protein [Oceanotoga]MDO7976833.1 hypothetical protein [Oceanotoga teriensis]PWJ95910.1 hypothetical protein C7380_10388 [Oceanotoga teriensis]UYP00864.1 hypothetical protein OF820_04065 [Oceanotoga sp. DSM 15011]